MRRGRMLKIGGTVSDDDSRTPWPAAPATAFAPPQHPTVRPANGAMAWALGLIAFVPIPLLGAFASGIAMAIGYAASAKRSDLARANARAAANWGITFTVVSTIILVIHFFLAWGVTQGRGTPDFYPLGIPITIYGVLVLVHIVLVIVGTVRSSQGKSMRVPFAIPFVSR